jgi:hypothetical protein
VRFGDFRASNHKIESRRTARNFARFAEIYPAILCRDWREKFKRNLSRALQKELLTLNTKL